MRRAAHALFATSVALVGLSAIGGQPPADATATSLSGFEDMIVDEAHGHIFVSTGESVVVTDLAGKHLSTIEGLSAADGLAFDATGSVLYVARPGDAVISEVDTESFDVTDHPTPGRCPETLAPVGDAIWFSGHRACNYSSVSGLDLTTGEVVDHPERYYESMVATSPARPGIVAVAEVHIGGAQVELYQAVADADGPRLVKVAERFSSLIADMAFTPDGTALVVAGNDEVQPLSPLDLSPVGPAYDTGPHFDPLAFAGDGTLAVGRAVFPPGATEPSTVIWLPDRRIMGSAWVDDRLFSVTRDHETESVYLLEQMDLRRKPRVKIRRPGDLIVRYGQTIALTLTLDTASTENRTVDLYARRVNGDERLVRSVEVGPEGRTVELIARRTQRYRAFYAGDELALADEQSLLVPVHVRVHARPVGGHEIVGAPGSTEYLPGEAARVRGRISPLRAGRRITVLLAVEGPYVSEVFERWRTRTDADGRFRVRAPARFFENDKIYSIFVRHPGTEDLKPGLGWSGPFRYADDVTRWLSRHLVTENPPHLSVDCRPVEWGRCPTRA